MKEYPMAYEYENSLYIEAPEADLKSIDRYFEENEGVEFIDSILEYGLYLYNTISRTGMNEAKEIARKYPEAELTLHYVSREANNYGQAVLKGPGVELDDRKEPKLGEFLDKAADEEESEPLDWVEEQFYDDTEYEEVDDDDEDEDDENRDD
jgi:hypothetical protein